MSTLNTEYQWYVRNAESFLVHVLTKRVLGKVRHCCGVFVAETEMHGRIGEYIDPAPARDAVSIRLHVHPVGEVLAA